MQIERAGKGTIVYFDDQAYADAEALARALKLNVKTSRSRIVRDLLRAAAEKVGAPKLGQQVIAGAGPVVYTSDNPDSERLRQALAAPGAPSMRALGRLCGYARHDMISQMAAGRRPLSEPVRAWLAEQGK